MNKNNFAPNSGQNLFPPVFFFPNTVKTAFFHPSGQNCQPYLLQCSTVIYHNNGKLAFADTESFTQSFKLKKKLIKAVSSTKNRQNVRSKSLKKNEDNSINFNCIHFLSHHMVK